MRAPRLVVASLTVVVLSPWAFALDGEHDAKARAIIDKAIAYLRTQQDEKTGGWGLRDKGPQFPAITALVVTGMVMDPRIDATDPSVKKGVDFILGFRQPDGGIYDRILPSYNTSISLSALSRINTPEAAAAIGPAQDFLRSIQWSEQTKASPDTPSDAPAFGKVTKDHPYYGGIGYGGESRPDGSNLGMMLEALHDSGLSCDDPAFQRALVFLQRTQMDGRVNDMPYAQGSRQGGFIYATSPDKDHVGQGESKAGMIEETLDNGEKVSRLRAYGSMTYSGFKSYVYANLKRDDPRVRAAFEWICRNYTVDENPGVGTQGLYYYYLTFARALRAWGDSTIPTESADGSPSASRDWANDLIDKLGALQRPDGSFVNATDRWMEGNPALVTAYALIALQEAID